MDMTTIIFNVKLWLMNRTISMHSIKKMINYRLWLL